jgi:hypothetical protein
MDLLMESSLADTTDKLIGTDECPRLPLLRELA